MDSNNSVKFYCKSSLNKEQLNHRNELLTDGIELQLLKDFVDNPLSNSEYIEQLGDNISKIFAIHIPLDKDKEYSDLQTLNNPSQRNILERACSLAQQISVINNRETLVVLHNSYSLEELNEDDTLFESISSFFYYLLITYPSIKIGIENVIPLLHRRLLFRNGCLPSYTSVVKELRANLHTDRIGSVLDTCHALTTFRTLELIYEHEYYPIPISMEDFFKLNEGVCFLVHLADVKGLGLQNNTHGISFSDDTTSDLMELMDLYTKYIPGTPITIEVIENDYTDCINYSKTRNLVENYI